MATNDFTHDLVNKLSEENLEYLVIVIQKGESEHKANAYFNIVTVDGVDMIATTIDEVFNQIGGDGPDEFEIGPNKKFPKRSSDEDDEYKEGAD